MIVNPAKLGMCEKFAQDELLNRGLIPSENGKIFEELTLKYYILSSNCEERIKNYEPSKLNY